ncbi:methyltransferase CmcJ [Diaporthe helianthi]|uniref:Methyltransferase CmcJ n=1 Tax=Diaporthe helianthi TaxID=158607 RepID=A0A2P5HZE3_DIAHE|nr:methyltransferase CmcJ [Diaporthe helianthi]
MPPSLGYENIVLNALEDIVEFEDVMGAWIKKFFDADTVISMTTNDDFYILDSVSLYYALETLHLRYKPDYRWLYISDQTQEDVIMWLQFDTHPPKKLFPQTPYAVVKVDNPPAGCEPRRSIDMRYVVLSRPPPGAERVLFPEADSLETRKQPWKGRVEFKHVHPPRYILLVSKTSMCRIGTVAANAEPLTAVSAK